MTTDNASTPVSSIDPKTLSKLVDAVREDPELLPEEKETTFHEGNSDDQLIIFSEQSGVMRRLIRHPLFEIEWIRVYSETSRTATMGVAEYSEGLITGVKGYLPIGALKIQSGCRSDSAPCKIVSKASLRDASREVAE